MGESNSESDLKGLLASPEIKQAILKLVETGQKGLEIWGKRIENEDKASSRSNYRFLIITIGLFVTIVGAVTALTLSDKLSPESTGFLLGVITTGAIAIIRDFTKGDDRFST